MKNHIENYDHLIEVDHEKMLLVIYRVYCDGSKHLFTSIPFPSKLFSEDAILFKDFAQKIGENLLIDSPIARSILKI